MTAVVLDARNARTGGGMTFARELTPRLADVLASRGFRLRSFVGRGTPRESVARVAALSVASAILHAGNRAMPTPRARQVLCVRDRLLLDDGPRFRSDVRTTLRRMVLRASLHVADVVVVPSASMISPLLAFWGKGSREPIVIPHGRPAWSLPPPRPLSEPVRLLYPSHVGTHKNFSLLTRALKSRRSRPGPRLQLTLTANAADRVGASSLGDLFAASLDSVSFVGPVAADLLAELYLRHDILVFPSFVESFGLPLVEAMTTGMPIVVSDADWARELCGDAAVYATASDVDAWNAALDRVIATGTRANERGVARSRHFDWDESARQYAAVLLG